MRNILVPSALALAAALSTPVLARPMTEVDLATLKRVGGGIEVGSIGSGDLDVDGVRGDLHVRSIGSGDISHHGVAGKVEIPSRDED